MQTIVNNRYWLLLSFCLFLSFSSYSQVKKLRGHIHYEDGKRVVNAEIQLGDAFGNRNIVVVTSDANGEFEAEIPESAKVNTAIVRKEGESFIQTQLGYVRVDGNIGRAIKIKVIRPGFFVGNIKNNAGVAVKDISVRIQSNQVSGRAKTDNDGDFFIPISNGKKVDNSLKITIEGNRLSSSSFQLNQAAQTVEVVYEKPTNEVDLGRKPRAGVIRPKEPEVVALVYNVFLVDTNNQRLPNTPFLIEETQHQSDSNGVILYRGEIPAADKFVAPAGFLKKQVKRNDYRKEVTVILEKKLSLKDLELPLDKDSYETQLELIAVGLEEEQIALNARGMELRREIARLATKLSQERNLKANEKDNISSALALLEHTLEENDKEYRRSQERTQSLLEKMRNDLDFVAQRNKEIEEKARQQMIIFLLVTASLIGLVLIFYFISDKMRRQRNELELTRGMLEEKVEEVRVKNEQILSQTDKLKALNHTISSKSRKITDSISYAHSIQMAILPKAEVLKDSLKDFFILYRSKELVSGDFYWCSKQTTKTGKQSTILAAVDCTGHGVPGGFMSMIAHTLLSEIINHKHIYDPQAILQELNMGMRASLQQDERLIQDGMDIGICTVTEAEGSDKVEVSFSGARRPLIYIEEGQGEVTYLKGDKRSVGGVHAAEINHQFLKHDLVLPKSSMLYLTSDGFVEQGTSKIGKIGTKQFLESLKQHAHFSMEEQKALLEKLLMDYQVTQDQRDDILVFGIKV